MDDRPEVRSTEDRRRPARGLSRILVGVTAVFGLVVLCPAVVSLIRHPDQAPVLDAIDAVAGALYLMLAVCMAHNGRRMRMIGWVCLGGLLSGAMLLGLLTITGTAPELEASFLAHGGRGHGYLPLVLPIMAAFWMWMSDPRRIVVHAEMITDLASARSDRSGKDRASGEARE
ncbi:MULTISPECIES: hypothetical protein [Actinomyces]|uniref:Uncharacterized protein n=1 Tax=Actinomyces marmotae TaxID=2737173 RepID=A0A6M8B1V5_9ACTO|nr:MULTISPECIES: hypothetical protein [Actinomyces]QKD79812.1 hypothetical protein HPC72_05735 [Actinomyces marmotae]